MVLVTSSGYRQAASQEGSSIKNVSPGTCSTRFVSHADDSPEAFREEIKESISEESKAGKDVSVHKAPAYLVERSAIKCSVLLRANLGTVQSQRIFIALGALLI